MLGTVVSRLSHFLASSVPLQQLTKYQLEIYRAPANEVWNPKSEEYVPQVVESQNIKKLKGLPFPSFCLISHNDVLPSPGQKMYDQADAAWEAEMRKKLGQDKSKNKVTVEPSFGVKSRQEAEPPPCPVRLPS